MPMITAAVTFLTDKRDGETYVEAKDFRSFLVYKNMDLTGCNAFECAMSAPLRRRGDPPCG